MVDKSKRRFLKLSAATAASAVFSPAELLAHSQSQSIIASAKSEALAATNSEALGAAEEIFRMLSALDEVRFSATNEKWMELALTNQISALQAKNPSRASILSALRSEAFQNSFLAESMLANDEVNGICDEVFRLSRLSPEKIADAVAEEIDYAKSSRPKSFEKKLPAYSSMAAARKAGGYPVTKDYPHPCAARIGVHRTSGEWRERASMQATMVSEPSR